MLQWSEAGRPITLNNLIFYGIYSFPDVNKITFHKILQNEIMWVKKKKGGRKFWGVKGKRVNFVCASVFTW